MSDMATHMLFITVRIIWSSSRTSLIALIVSLCVFRTASVRTRPPPDAPCARDALELGTARPSPRTSATLHAVPAVPAKPSMPAVPAESAEFAVPGTSSSPTGSNCNVTEEDTTHELPFHKSDGICHLHI